MGPFCLSVFSAISAVSFAAGLLAALPVIACDDLKAGPAAIVAAVPDGGTLVLDNGDKVRLIGMQAPKLAMGRAGIEDWPLAETARQTLENMVLGQKVSLKFGGTQKDRHGRVLAQVFTGPNQDISVQAAMVAAGMARVYGFADNRACLDDLLAAERSARRDLKGIWADPFFAIQDAARPGELLDRRDRFELVEGRVLLVDQVRDRIYFNFGRYWKEDFTLIMDKSAIKLFEPAGVDPFGFEGALVRVRGWIEERDGPMMALTHPEQIEVVAR